jgi:replication factor C large subunit
MPFAERYRPKNLKEFIDQKEALEKFLKWIKRWKPDSKPLLFYGQPGVGKTALIEAYAGENKLEFIQMNASDWRSASQIQEVLGQSMLQMPLFKKGKIFLIDEVDGIAGREDLGGVGAIIKIIKQTRFPVVLIANNPYDSRLRTLRQYCELVKFDKISVWDMEKRLEHICQKENIEIDKEVLRQLVKRDEGDLRSAMTDLEILSQGKKIIGTEDLNILGHREREENIFDALKAIFKTQNALASKLSINNVDKDPEEIFWWIENNVAAEYEDPEEIAKAFDMLSKADLFRNRIVSRQNWGFRAYMIDLMTAGVSTAKKSMYRKFTRYQYPRNIMILGRTKAARAEASGVLRILSSELHASKEKIRKEYLPYLKIIFRNKKLRSQIVSSLNIDKDQLLSLFK